MKSRPGQHTGPSLFERGRSLLAPPPSRTGEKYRHELKYLISYADKAELVVRLAPVLHLDPHAQQGGYFIRSLYFDDYWNTAYEEKDAGVLLRKKYRIRIYNCSDRSIKLERKKKFGSYIYKEAAPLTHAEFRSSIQTRADRRSYRSTAHTWKLQSAPAHGAGGYPARPAADTL